MILPGTKKGYPIGNSFGTFFSKNMCAYHLSLLWFNLITLPYLPFKSSVIAWWPQSCVFFSLFCRSTGSVVYCLYWLLILWVKLTCSNLTWPCACPVPYVLSPDCALKQISPPVKSKMICAYFFPFRPLSLLPSISLFTPLYLCSLFLAPLSLPHSLSKS
jgi:hypothetical protein